jgi:hypothetical protein
MEYWAILACRGNYVVLNRTWQFGAIGKIWVPKVTAGSHGPKSGWISRSLICRLFYGLINKLLHVVSCVVSSPCVMNYLSSHVLISCPLFFFCKKWYHLTCHSMCRMCPRGPSFVTDTVTTHRFMFLYYAMLNFHGIQTFTLSSPTPYCM